MHGSLHSWALLSSCLPPKQMDALAAREISRMMADNSVTRDPRVPFSSLCPLSATSSVLAMVEGLDEMRTRGKRQSYNCISEWGGPHGTPPLLHFALYCSHL